MASFRKRAQKWQVRIQKKYHPTVSKSFTHLSDAKMWARQIERQYDLGLPYLDKNIQVSKILLRYRDEILPSKKNTQPDFYRINQILKFPIARLNFTKLTSQEICQFRDQLITQQKSANTVRLYLAILSHLFTVAKTEWGYDNLENPLLRIRKPRLPESVEKRISDEQIKLLCLHTQSPLLPDLIQIALATGMRCSEIIHLTTDDVLLEDKKIIVRNTKNYSDRMIPMSTQVVEIFKQRAVLDGRYFKMTPHAVSVAFSRACKRIGLTHISFHTLRHEAVSRFFEMGLNHMEVSAISGHKSFRMLKHYNHYNFAYLSRLMSTKIDISY